MRFDDRLLTVLNQPVDDRHDVAVRWRQLVDLVARAGSSDSPLIAQALLEIRETAPQVDESLRAAAARAVAALPLPFGLLEYFASDSLQVSAPVLAAATLEREQWQALSDGADDEIRRFIGTLHPQLGPQLAPLELTDELVDHEPDRQQSSPVPTLPPQPQPPAPGPTLSEVVARIERRRQRRSGPRLGTPGADGQAPPALFRWECGPSGEIAWVDGAPRGPLIGRSIARSSDAIGGVDQKAARAFSLRAPFRDATLTFPGEGLLSGAWKISGVPAFEPSDGRFAGYRGIALRDHPGEPDQVGLGSTELLADPYSVRELVHELRTPLNAILGFAEIIDGQYLGPADHRYRHRAAEIVTQARLLLTAIDDLDFAAKARSSDSSEQRTNLGALVERLMETLRSRAAQRGVTIDAARTLRDATATVDPDLAERLITRLCEWVIDHSGEDTRLRLTVERVGDRCRVAITRPAAIAELGDAPTDGDGDGDDLALQLVRGLAQFARVELATSQSDLALLFRRT